MFYLPVDVIERILRDAGGPVSASIDGPSPLRADAVAADRLNRASIAFTSGETPFVIALEGRRPPAYAEVE
jgi:hypothetical protein